MQQEYFILLSQGCTVLLYATVSVAIIFLHGTLVLSVHATKSESAKAILVTAEKRGKDRRILPSFPLLQRSQAILLSDANISQ